MKLTKFIWDQFCDELNNKVVQGLHNDVKTALTDLNVKKIPREHAFTLAEIAWRVSEPLLTLKILHDLIFPENTFSQPATAKEKMTYASALANLGATTDALTMLNQIDHSQEPEVLLRKAIANFKSWNYAASVPLLKEFISHPDVSAYKRLIGKVNLAAALINQSEFDAARLLLKGIQTECETQSHFLLLGNCFELLAQVEFYELRFESALSLLEKALLHLKNQAGDFSMYAEKWTLICLCFQNQKSPNQFSVALENFRALRNQALNLRHWETLREYDLFSAILTRDENLIRKVIMGSPSEHYRQRARRLFGNAVIPLGHYHYTLGSKSNAQEVFDPYAQQKDKEALYEKPMLLALFEALTQDFYQPSHIGALFQHIYKHEKFDPNTSPDRVLKLIKRLNLWFVAQSVSLRVRLKKSEFCLIAHDDHQIQILISKGKKLSKNGGQIHQLKRLFRDRTFSAQHVADKLNMSRGSARSLITQALKTGQIVKTGTGRATTYRLKSKYVKGLAA